MLIYLAAAYNRFKEMQGVRDVLVSLGHRVTSRWIDQQDRPGAVRGVRDRLNDDLPGYLEVVQYARADMADVDMADCLILFTDGGRNDNHTEFGYALAKNKYLIVVGPREHVFHTLTGEWYPNLAQLIAALTQRHPLSGLLSLAGPGQAPGTHTEDARVLAARLGVYREDQPDSPGGGDGPDQRYDPDEGLPWHGDLVPPHRLWGDGDYPVEGEHPHGYWGAGDYP